MADETHGIEIEIDSTAAEPGKQRVIRSLDEIKAKTSEVGKAGADAGQKFSDGLGKGATGAAGKAAKSMDEIRARAKAAGDGGRRAGESISDAFYRASTGVDRATAAAARLQPSIAQLDATAQRLGKARPFDSMQKQARSLLPDIVNLRNALVGLGVVELGRYVVNTEAQFRGFDQALKIVTGSTVKANQEMAFAEQVAGKYGLRIKDLTSSYVGLMAASRGTTLEGTRTREVFDAVTKAGVAYGLSNDNIRGSLLALQQMISKGNVQAEELRGQLGERLPGAFQVAARAMNVTTAELSKMLEAGQVTSADFLPKFAKQLQKEIPDGATSAYQAFNQFLNVLDQVTRVVANSGVFKGLTDGATGLAQALKGFVTDGTLATLAGGIGSLLTLLGQNAGLLKAAAVAYGVYFASVKLGAVLAWAGELIALERALGASTAASAIASAGLKGLQAVMASLLSTTVLITAGIAGLVLAFMSVNSSGNQTSALIASVAESTKTANLALREAQQRAGTAAVSVSSVGKEANGAVAQVDSFAGAVGRAAQQLYELAKAKQAAALSDLIAKRNESAAQFNQVRAQTDIGLNERAANARNTIQGGSGLGRVGNVVRGVGQSLGVIRDSASKAFGFGPDEEQLYKAGAQAAAAVKAYDQSIQLAKSSLEQFVTTQDKAAAAASTAVKPSLAMANALAQEAGAVTDMQKAQAGLNMTRVQAAADLKAGKISMDEYASRVGAAAKAVNNMKEAARGNSKALAEQRKMLAEANRNANTVGRINDRYNDQPRFLDQLDRDSQALKDMVGQWVDVGDAVVRYTEAMRKADQAQLDLAKNKPFGDLTQDLNNELALQTMLLQGRREEAAAIREKIAYERQFGKMLPEQYQQILANAVAQEQINRALEDQRRTVSLYLATVNELQDVFEQFLNDAMTNPFKATITAAKGVVQSLKKMVIREISNGIFGGIEREIEDMVTGRNGVQAASQQLVKSTETATSSTYTLADAMVDAAQLIAGAASKAASQISGLPGGGGDSGGATVDADGNIVVTGRRQTKAQTAAQVDYRQKTIEKVVGRVGGGLEKLWNSMPKGMQNVLRSVGGTVEKGLNKIGITLPKGVEAISSTIKKGLGGAMEGAAASGALGMLGIKQSSTGAAVGGAIGAIGSFLPGGSIVGGLIGGTLGGLFGGGKKNYTASTIQTTSTGALTSAAAGSRGKNMGGAANGAADSVISGLQSLAAQLGGQVTGTPRVSIGTYDGDWRVSTVGQTGELSYGKKNKQKDALFDFKDDQAAAVAFAVQTAVKQGVITGISDASRRVLTSSNNTEAAVQAATTYEGLLRQAAKLKDPIGASLKEIKDGMDATLTSLRQAGYSAEDLAKVQSVFVAQQKEAMDQLTSGYRAFLSDITTGPESGLTILDQYKAAQTAFGQAKAGLATGETTQDEFTEAGQRLFQLARATYGTATPEFEGVKADLIAATQAAMQQVESRTSDTGVITAIQASATTAQTQQAEANRYLAEIAAALSAQGVQANGAGYYGGSAGGSYTDKKAAY